MKMVSREEADSTKTVARTMEVETVKMVSTEEADSTKTMARTREAETVKMVSRDGADFLNGTDPPPPVRGKSSKVAGLKCEDDYESCQVFSLEHVNYLVGTDRPQNRMATVEAFRARLALIENPNFVPPASTKPHFASATPKQVKLQNAMPKMRKATTTSAEYAELLRGPLPSS